MAAALPVTLLFLGVLVSFAGIALMITYVVGLKKHHLSSTDKVVLAWLLFDSEVRVCLVGSYLLLLLSTGGVKWSDSTVAILWKEMGKVDKKWLDANPVLVAVHISALTTVPLCFLAILGLVNESFYRHYFQIILSFSELYNVWLIGSTEWLANEMNLQYTGSLWHLWVFMVLGYGLWLFFPLVLLVNAWWHLKEVFSFREQYLARQDVYTSCTNLPDKERSRSAIQVSSSGHVRHDATRKQKSSRSELQFTSV